LRKMQARTFIPIFEMAKKRHKSKQGNYLDERILKEDVPLHFISANNAETLGFSQSENQQRPFVALKYYQANYQCFSVWNATELKGFSGFNQKLSQTTWQQIKNQSGKSDKAGFAYTQINRDQYPKSPVFDQISDDINFFELRVSGKARVHGFRINAIFFLVFLDKDHSIGSSKNKR